MRKPGFRLLAIVCAWAAGAMSATPASAELIGHGGPVRSIAVSSDGAMALTGSFDYSLMLWDLRSARALHRMTGQDAAVGAVAFVGPDRLVSGSDDGTLALWDRATGALILRKPAHSGKVSALAISADGAVIASAGWDRSVRLWRAGDLSPVASIETAENVNALVITPDGALAGGGYDAGLRLWDPRSAAEIAALTGHEAGINALLALPDGRLVSASSDRTVRLWDVPARAEAGVLLGAEAAVLSLSAASDGRWIAAGDAAGFLTVWDASGKPFRRWQAHGGPVWALAAAGAQLLSAGADGLVRNWTILGDGPTGENIRADGAPLAALSGSTDPGARLFAKCAACHTLTPEGGNKAGPTLYGLFGRRAGTVADYPYSPALRNSAIVWTEHTVDRLFALGPQEVTPGSKMPLQRMPDAAERAALIAFLQRTTRTQGDGEGQAQ
jgi:cytochrome c